MNTETNNSDNWSLHVYRDSHLVGSMPMPAAGLLTVGNGAEYDVVLRDSKAQGTVLTLAIEYPAISLTVNSGQIAVDNQTWQSGEQFLCDERSIQVGKLTLLFEGIQNSGESAPMLAVLPENEDAYQNDAEAISLLSASGNLKPQSGEQSGAVDGRRRWITGTLLASMLMIFSVGSWQVIAAFQKTQPEPEILVKGFVEDAGLDGLAFEASDTELVLSGTVNSTQERMQVEQFLREQSFNVKQQILVLEQLKAQLEDVFRINGVNAIVTIDDAGVLQAATQADEQKLEEVRLAVATDLPQLQNWTINNVPPPVLARKVKEDPGKRVAMVVSDEPAYVLTVDQTRYFVGSLLPTGHKIEDIRNGRVYLLKDSTKSELDF